MAESIEKRPWESGTEEAEAYLRSGLSVQDVMTRSGLSRNSINAVLRDAKAVLPSTLRRFQCALSSDAPSSGLAEAEEPFVCPLTPPPCSAFPEPQLFFAQKAQAAAAFVSQLKEVETRFEQKETEGAALEVRQLLNELKRVMTEIEIVRECSEGP